MHEGRVLKVLIKEKGYIQEAFGEAIGVSRMYIAQMVRREVLPDTFIKKLNDFLKIDFRKQAAQFAESRNIVEAFVNMSAAKPANQTDESTRSQVEALNNYIIDLQKQLLEAKDTIRNLEHHISKMENQLPAQKRRAVAVAIHSKKN